MKSLSDIDLGWLVGLLEGEGCIHISHTYTTIDGKRYGPYETVLVQISMSDEDVVLRLLDVTGVGVVTKVKKKKKEYYKDQWCWRVAKQADTRSILNAVLPHLGQRRQYKAEEALEVLSRKEGSGNG